MRSGLAPFRVTYIDGMKGTSRIVTHLREFMNRKNITPAQMTPELAREFVGEVLFSDDPPIRNYREKIYRGMEEMEGKPRNEPPPRRPGWPRLGPGRGGPVRGGGDEE